MGPGVPRERRGGTARAGHRAPAPGCPGHGKCCSRVLGGDLCSQWRWKGQEGGKAHARLRVLMGAP